LGAACDRFEGDPVVQASLDNIVRTLDGPPVTHALKGSFDCVAVRFAVRFAGGNFAQDDNSKEVLGFM
jgi:hypothetical protein